MAHIQINKREFESLLGEKVSDETLEKKASYLGVHWNHVEGDKWDVETYPNRPDLLSVEGLARAYRAYFGIETGMPKYEVKEGDLDLVVEDSVEQVRPFIGGAVIRNVELDERAINGLVQLQEKIHETMGRKRDKLAIGLHDMSDLEPPFIYKAVEPEKVSFKPLEYDRDMNLGEIIDEHEKGLEYSWILDDEEKYPVIEDSEGKVLSFPPIINNQLTEVEEDTTDVFIDVTGKDLETVKKALNILATAMAERGGEIHAVSVDGDTLPNLTPEKRELSLEYLNQVSGLELSLKNAKSLLEQMGYSVEAKSGKLNVKVPSYRTDIMHSYDLIEDVVIAHGYDNVEPELPNIDQIGSEKKIEEFSRVLREALIGAGALEAHTFALSSKEKLFENMEVEKSSHASMSNALTEDYEVVRNWMLPSLMEILKRNRHHEYPQEFFEVGEVVEMPNAENSKKLCFVTAGEVGYTDARQRLQVLENALGLDLELIEASYGFSKASRVAEIRIDGEEAGFIAELHEEVLDNWGMTENVSAFEIDVEKLKKKYH